MSNSKKMLIVGDIHCMETSKKMKIPKNVETIVLEGDVFSSGNVSPENLKAIQKICPVIEIKTIYDLRKLQMIENHDQLLIKQK